MKELKQGALAGMSLGLGLRHRVNPPRVKGMAAQHPFQSQPETTQGTMHLYRLTGIVGTGGIITAVVTQKGAKQITVALDQPDKRLFHSSTTIQYKYILIIPGPAPYGTQEKQHLFCGNNGKSVIDGTRITQPVLSLTHCTHGRKRLSPTRDRPATRRPPDPLP